MTRFLASLASIVTLLFVVSAQAEPPSAADALKDRVLGDANAPIEIIEYASLTCTHCRDFHVDVMPDLKKNYLPSPIFTAGHSCSLMLLHTPSTLRNMPIG